jgi:hypothetical protein
LQWRQSRYGESTWKRNVKEQNKTSETTFPRNLAPPFTHYLSEQPEMSSHDEG